MTNILLAIAIAADPASLKMRPVPTPEEFAVDPG
jgi:hypothetical protein